VFPRDTEVHEQTVRGPCARAVCAGPSPRRRAREQPEHLTTAGDSEARGDGPRRDPVNDFLVTFLDSIDERLLEYLDEDEELRLDVVQRLPKPANDPSGNQPVEQTQIKS